MILLSFSGFLRYDEVSSLRFNDVKVHDNHLVLHLEKSKTDKPGEINKFLNRYGNLLMKHILKTLNIDMQQ
jgi:hypothetical protein